MLPVSLSGLYLFISLIYILMKTVFIFNFDFFFHIYYFVLAQVAYFQNKIALQCEMFSVFIYNKSLCFFVLLNIVGKKKAFLPV